jgi:hypothetical protein
LQGTAAAARGLTRGKTTLPARRREGRKGRVNRGTGDERREFETRSNEPRSQTEPWNESSNPNRLANGWPLTCGRADSLPRL